MSHRSSLLQVVCTTCQVCSNTTHLFICLEKIQVYHARAGRSIY